MALKEDPKPAHLILLRGTLPLIQFYLDPETCQAPLVNVRTDPRRIHGNANRAGFGDKILLKCPLPARRRLHSKIIL